MNKAVRKLPLTDVPTNIITGFLGVGKTTAILNLLERKPPDERWAVLVNEFGEIGVDGGLMEGRQGEEQQVFVKEVPGGCMCCASGIQMQVALNHLLAISTPDRLLIEPTGLGHPREVLQVLSSGPYRRALDVQRTITLVDARQLENQRYTEHEIFRQQIEVADTVVGNKSDLYQSHNRERLYQFLKEDMQSNAEVAFASYGELDVSLLAGKAGCLNTSESGKTGHHHHSHNLEHDHTLPLNTDSLPASGYIKKINQGEGFYSVGWRFREDMIFERSQLFSLLSGIQAQRVKAVMNTGDGPFGYNFAADSLTEVKLFSRGQSCIEIICRDVDDNWEAKLLQCVEDSTIVD